MTRSPIIETGNIGSHGHSSLLSESNGDPKTGGRNTEFLSGATVSGAQHTAHGSTKPRGRSSTQGKHLKHVSASVNRKKSRSKKKDSQSHSVSVVCDKPNINVHVSDTVSQHGADVNNDDKGEESSIINLDGLTKDDMEGGSENYFVYDYNYNMEGARETDFLDYDLPFSGSHSQIEPPDKHIAQNSTAAKRRKCDVDY